MIIFLAREGQMCNQLTSLASLYSLGLEYNEDIMCPVIDESLKEFFAFDSRGDTIKVNYRESKLSNVVLFCLKIVKKICPTLLKKKYKPQNAKKTQLFMDWFSFFEFDTLIKHAEDIRKYFAFNEEINKICDDIIKQVRSDEYSRLVGVHIRRGDYKEFHGGKWYYSDDEYCHWMKQLAVENKVKFIISSNEKLDLDIFRKEGLDIIQPGHSAIEDLCLLSKCDYIMGPPSTYSAWAALVGGKKRCILRNRNEDCLWNNFLYTEEHMKNGEPFQ